MKKFLLIATVVTAFVAVLALGITSWAFAQAPDPDDTVCPYCGSYGAGMMGGRGGRGGQYGEAGPLHDYMFPAIAEALGLSTDELQAAHDAGKTAWVIAQEQGKTFEEFQTLMAEARSKAFTQAVADGVITQAQADWMLERMNGAQGNGYGAGMMGAGGCGGYGPGNRGGGRWNNQP